MNADLIKTSKFLSLVLRHKPETIGLTLDENGWADVGELIRLARQKGRNLSHGMIEQIVRDYDKKRFNLSTDGQRIRANQGHSIVVELQLQMHQPPGILLHSTATRFLDSIQASLEYMVRNANQNYRKENR